MSRVLGYDGDLPWPPPPLPPRTAGWLVQPGKTYSMHDEVIVEELRDGSVRNLPGRRMFLEEAVPGRRSPLWYDLAEFFGTEAAGRACLVLDARYPPGSPELAQLETAVHLLCGAYESDPLLAMDALDDALRALLELGEEPLLERAWVS